MLTWILKDALGGNSHTVMICAVDPSSECAETTLTTLRYADVAKRIVTKPVVNVDTERAKRLELMKALAAISEKVCQL